MADKILVMVGATDLTSYIKSYNLEYNILVKEDGRNASGNKTINIINRKAKINIVLRPTNEIEMAAILNAISAFVFSVQYWDPKTKTQLTKTMIVNDPSADLYSNGNQTGIYNEISLSFIEL